MAEFEKGVELILIREGGYINDPDDRGGETKYGISRRAYPDIDIKNLTKMDATLIYQRDYWNKIEGDRICLQVIAETIFDSAVNMGVRTASKLAQQTVGTTPDGVIGPSTLGELNITDEEKFLLGYTLGKIARYAAICNRNPSQKKFLLGWLNRALGA